MKKNLKGLMEKKVAMKIQKFAGSLAEQSVGKSLMIYGFEPEIPEELKKRLKK